MRHAGKFLLLAACAALTACTGADRPGSGAGAGADGQALGSASDPASVAYFQQTLGDRVFFEVDRSTLSDEGRATLDAQAEWLLANAEREAVIEGHTDERGTREYNLALGARRANAVMEHLQSRGVPASRLRMLSYGKERPVAVCSAERCYGLNRRAVTAIGGPEG